ncbi:PLP-dependent transferase [Mytilinidion resinicola]|uniref:PLP-dependent transferase n=1 Tax=Mytilinidion resinicola TaxID=574789 RepID=A0A6A6YHC0_9PEZI|nr:PLP-dependent transferase [Mytilinidion resinicola]KAF2807297.1 PLP-dependent transferase [Mytilinidion resinicola]
MDLLNNWYFLRDLPLLITTSSNLHSSNYGGISKYLSNTNVQLGASYSASQQSTSKYGAGCDAATKYMNANPGEVVLGASTTQLFRNLSFSLNFEAGDEIILSKVDHESDIDPWLDMAKRCNMTIKWWSPASSVNPKLTPESLKALLSPKTKFVACTHSSNILGTIHDIRSIAQTVHSIPGALFGVDGVAYAPHRQIDVKELGVDFYGFSWYKVYGPHIAALYASSAIQDRLHPMGHYFNPTATLEDKIGLAGANYELTQSIPLIVSYLGGDSPKPVFESIAKHEEKLQSILLTYLMSRKDVMIHGETSSDSSLRVPTISFTVADVSSRKVVEDAEKISNFGFRWGHFYSKRLCDEVLKLGSEGVIRVSMIHYNTEEEVRSLVGTLKKVLP